MSQGDVLSVMKPGEKLSMRDIVERLPYMSPRTVGNNVSQARKSQKIRVAGSRPQPHNNRPALLYEVIE